jgi:hypothetical protein
LAWTPRAIVFSASDLSTRAAALLVLLDDEDPFFSEQDDVLVAKHGATE